MYNNGLIQTWPDFVQKFDTKVYKLIHKYPYMNIFLGF